MEPRSRVVVLASLALGALLASGCGGSGETPSTPEAADLIGPGPHEVAVLAIGDLGAIRLELLPEIAPDTVDNFKRLARQGFYDGTTFHRVIPGFMIQGGDPLSRNDDPRDDGKGGPGYTIFDEISAVPARRGMVAMARKSVQDSAGSQFFIVHQDAPHLDGNYTIFGRVVDGIEVIDAITELEIDTYGRWGPRDRPHPRDARIEAVRIEPIEAVRIEPAPSDREEDSLSG